MFKEFVLGKQSTTNHVYKPWLYDSTNHFKFEREMGTICKIDNGFSSLKFSFQSSTKALVK